MIKRAELADIIRGFCHAFEKNALDALGESFKSGDFRTSQYSGPVFYGKFKQESQIPSFNEPPVVTKTSAAVQGMASTGMQTKGPQLYFSATKQLNASRDIAKIDATQPSDKGLMGIKGLPSIGSAL